ncbi:MAG TPA: YsnF/AvaK domain-containing protein [Nitrososphaeraceae archaeon]|nr:YsnF/AvaK domain-containing protein [Nitrososphaeraceae archaeon]
MEGTTLGLLASNSSFRSKKSLSSIKFYVLYSYSAMESNTDTNTDSSTINWDDVIKKEARGIDDADLGKVQGLSEPFVFTQRGTLNKEKFYIPKSLVEGYDGVTLQFHVTEEEAKNMYMRDSPPSDEEVQHVQIMTERLVASKRETTGEELTIIKEPATETKTVQVQLTHEEPIIERNPVGEATSSLHPVQSIKEIKIPLKKEEIEVSKQPYVKEEVVIRKKPVIETRTVTEEVKSEKVKVRRGTEEEEEEIV